METGLKNFEAIIKNIEYLGEKYKEEHLAEWNKNTDLLENDWWEGLKFFFKHSFMRGRRDVLSNEYCEFALTIIKEKYNIDDPRNCAIYYSNLDEAYKNLVKDKHYFDKKIILQAKQNLGSGRKSFLKDEKLKEEIINKNPVIRMFVTPRNISFKWLNQEYNITTRLENDDDTMMVLDTLKFIASKFENRNIYKVIKDNLENKQIKEVYEFLIGPRNVNISEKNFHAIGDKIATLIIRDILLLNPGIEINNQNDLELVFPVDTWVRRIARKLGIQFENDNAIKKFFISVCREYKINVPKCAAGLWYLGFQSLDILINFCLDKVDLRSAKAV